MKKIKVIPIVAMLALLLVSLCSCKKVNTYDAEKLCKIEVTGTNGNGTASITSDYDYISDITDDVLGDNPNDYDVLALSVLFETVKFDTDSETSQLSNGDTIKITLNYSSDRFKDYGIKFKNTSFEYKVSGLSEAVEIDLFKGLNIKYEGISPNAIVLIDNTKCDSFIKDNVSFSADKNYVANGDTITVTAYCRQSKLDENNYAVKSMTKEFNVSGLSEYITDTASYDFSSIDDKLKAEAQSVVDRSSYVVGEEIFSGKLVPSGNLTEKWTVKSVELSPVRKIFMKANDPSAWNRNNYVIFWNLKVTAEKTYSDSYVSEKDGYNVGDVEDFNIFIETSITNIVNIKKSLTTKYAHISSTAYGNTILGNYIGMSLDEIVDHYSLDFSDYTMKPIE